MNYWLLKTEPTDYSIDDLKKDKKVLWTGVRNFLARNFIKQMERGDLVFIYHSSTEIPGIYGIGKIVKKAVPDASAFNKKDSHFDPKSTKANPVWFAPEISFQEKFKNPLTLSFIKDDKELSNMFVARQGSRLSVTPVEKKHFELIIKIINKKSPELIKNERRIGVSERRVPN